MELPPRLYHLLVRPNWFSNFLINYVAIHNINFNCKNALDFGCGIGSNTALFSPSHYLGIDNDPKRVEYAKRLYPDYTFRVSHENQQLPVEDTTIDYVFISSVLHHIPTDGIRFYLEEFQRISRPQGRIIAIEPCFFSGCYLANGFMSYLDRGKYIRTEKEYIDIFDECDYKTEIIDRFNELLFYNKLFFTAIHKQ